jgi:predicted ATP-grasp superfamily ATP-dependent carboligase
MASPPPVLLTSGQFYGTLAAARCLGRAGVPVTLADGHPLAPARWSRHVTRVVPCPETSDTEAFLAWLTDFGARSPGHVLLPCNDDTAWLVAAERDALSKHFHLLPTPFSAIEALLDKRTLGDRCREAGLGAPETWFPRSEEEALACAREAGLPLLFKPRTQVLLDSHSKGILVEEIGQIVPRFRDYVARNHHGERLLRRSPDAKWPMLQRYYPDAQRNIYSLVGYADGAGQILAARAARKILQRPRKLGIGLCFEEAPVDERLLAGVRALCRGVGYQGVFEAELVETGSGWRLIDFNPRFYSQMAFDVDRGSPLPHMAYADALGDAATLAALAAGAATGQAPSSPPRVYIHRFLFEVMVRGQSLSGRLSAAEKGRWRSWWKAHRSIATDAVFDRDDRLPWAADTATHLTSIARHPRSFVRSMILDR